MIYIIKRDGRKKKFDKFKIVDAVLAAFKSVDGTVTEYAEIKAGNIADYIQDYAENPTSYCLYAGYPNRFPAIR